MHILVTGATGGIGGAIARGLHKQGATVALSGFSAPFEFLDGVYAPAADAAAPPPGDRSDEPRKQIH